MKQTVDVDAAIDANKVGLYQFVVVLLCMLTMTFDGYANQTIGIIAPSLANDLGLNVKTFGPVFASGLLGMMLGALVMGPVADRVGRRWPVVLSATLFGLLMLVTTSARSIPELMGYRFLTGLGIGGALPNAVSMSTEFVPSRLERRIVGWVFTGIPIGAVVGGALSATLLPVAGWRSVLYVGGGISLLLALSLAIWLPESVRFLVHTKASPERISRVMRQVLPHLELPQGARFQESHAPLERLPVSQLFAERRTVDTLLFWVAFFMNLLILYFVLSWLTAMLLDAGMVLRMAVIATTVFSVGGIFGNSSVGYLMDSFGPRRIVIVELVLTVLLIAALAIAHGSVWSVVLFVFLLGVAVAGAQTGMNALVAAFYPTTIRSTGLGWALGIGRIGSMVGPLLGGLMLSLSWSNQRIFAAGTIPAVAAAVAIGARALRERQRGRA